MKKHKKKQIPAKLEDLTEEQRNLIGLVYYSPSLDYENKLALIGFIWKNLIPIEREKELMQIFLDEQKSILEVGIKLENNIKTNYKKLLDHNKKLEKDNDEKLKKLTKTDFMEKIENLKKMKNRIWRFNLLLKDSQNTIPNILEIHFLEEKMLNI